MTQPDNPAEVPRKPRETLYDTELFWRDQYEALKNKGYELRPRLHPDWVPSWKGKRFRPGLQEDAQVFSPTNLCDATRISDGTFVVLKRLDRDNKYSKEEDLAVEFGSTPLLDDPRNHCVPLLDVFTLPPLSADDYPRRILVTPLLRFFNEPLWHTFGEAVECFRQIFEGVQFMHDHHTAHRDCTMLNIMMEPSMMLEPYHPVRMDLRRDFTGPARHTTRTKRPPRYVLIDLGLSRVYDPADGPALDLPVGGGDRTLPELKNYHTLCDPFAADIYYLGNWINQFFMQVYRGFEFMQPLVTDMIQTDPAKRPKIHEAVARLNAIIKSVGGWKLHSRTTTVFESSEDVLYRDLGHLPQRVLLTILRRPALPAPPPKVTIKSKEQTY